MPGLLVIRADANGEISAGHIRRCLSIADEWRARGGECLFVSADDVSAPFVKGAGFRHVALGTNWRDLSDEIPLMKELLQSSLYTPVLLVDTYAISDDYVAALSPFAHLGYLGTKRVFAPQLSFLINYSVAANLADYPESACKLLLGPKYTPLRRNFACCAPAASEAVRAILLTTGNSDALDMTPALIEALLPELASRGIVLKVVVGPLFSERKTLFERFSGDNHLVLLDGVSDMPALMRSCDVALSACGTTLYELAACGVPTVGFSVTPEQDSNEETATMRHLGVIEYVGHAYEEKAKCVQAACSSTFGLIDSPKRRVALSRAFHSLVDGMGCARICDAVEELEMGDGY